MSSRIAGAANGSKSSGIMKSTVSMVPRAAKKAVILLARR